MSENETTRQELTVAGTPLDAEAVAYAEKLTGLLYSVLTEVDRTFGRTEGRANSRSHLLGRQWVERQLENALQALGSQGYGVGDAQSLRDAPASGTAGTTSGAP